MCIKYLGTLKIFHTSIFDFSVITQVVATHFGKINTPLGELTQRAIWWDFQTSLIARCSQ